MSITKSDEWKIETQIYYPLIGEVALSPEGEKVAYTVREPILTSEESKFVNHIYLADVETGETIQLTHGSHNNTHPCWSPDGRYIAFISTRKEKTNLYVIDARGGEPWALTDNDKYGITELKWAPDGRSIAFLMPEPPSEEKERKKKAKDDAFLWHEEFDYSHLYRIPFSVGPRKIPEVAQITSGDFQVITFEWLGNGEYLALIHQPRPLAEDWSKTRLAMVSAEAMEPSRINDLRVIAPVATWTGTIKASPDGRWIACSVGDQPPKWAFSSRVVLFPTNGGAPRPLARTPDSQSHVIGWSSREESVFVQESSGVINQLWQLPASGETGHKITESEMLRKAFSVNPSGLIAYAAENFDLVNSIFVLDPKKEGSERMVVQPDLPEAWPNAVLPKAEVITWKSKDGIEIEGIIYYPMNYEEGERYPLVVEVHGGPTGVYGRTYVADPMRYGNTAVLTQKGFMMLRANPRGSSGYGKDFRFANYNDWGGGDYEDIMSGIDHLIDMDLVDPERIGIMGWSYGGYMTSWAITQTSRFKAACVGAGVTNLMSFNGTSDIPSFIPDYFNGEFWDDLEPYRSHSAMFQAKCVTTPTLIQHGEKDARVPVSQGQELYNALKKQGVPVRMVIYPRQEHGVNEPRLLIDVRKQSVQWLEHWILGK